MAGMRFGTVAALAGTLLGMGVAGAEAPRQVWTVSGLKNPESAIHDPAADVIYVSNTNSDVMVKDGNGFISRLSPDGQVLDLEWVSSLDSPTGLALAGGMLYAADIDRVVAIDPGKGAITARYHATGAQFLNDIAAGADGRLFAGDMLTDTIWVLENGRLSPWLQNEALESPNGLLVEDGRIVVGTWGRMTDGPRTKVPGHLKAVDLRTRQVASLGDPAPVGNIDGVAPDGRGGYFLTDWLTGGLFHATAQGEATRLLPLAHGSADLTALLDRKLLVVPMAADGTVVAYRID
jgi:hypothetical protein